MKRIIRTVGIMLLCGVLCCPLVEARGRNDNHHNGGQQRPSTGQQNRPSKHHGNNGGGHHKDNQGQRPGNPGSRPGNNGGGHRQDKPSHNNKPGKPDYGYRPGGGHGHKPGHGHGHGYGHYYRPTPPSRPYLPPPRPYYRPKPPRAWRPAANWRPFRSVLGVSFGSAINVSLNLLFNSGYTVQSYGPNAIYLSNVPMMNCYWPDATMYYNNGALAGSEFVYYTPYASSIRYDNVFNALCGSYGAPVSVVSNGGLVTASWWGTGNQYISLSYGGQYAGNGSLGYYTTLTFGI